MRRLRVSLKYSVIIGISIACILTLTSRFSENKTIGNIEVKLSLPVSMDPRNLMTKGATYGGHNGDAENVDTSSVDTKQHNSTNETELLPVIGTIQSQKSLENIPFGFDFVPEVFPNDGMVKIPKIIHQQWKGIRVPEQVVPYMKSWVNHHPDWNYMFWTEESGRFIISQKHPELLPYYDGYLHENRKADVIRYVVMYEYGGIVADLDLESIKPMDSILRKYSCILPQETPEHGSFGENVGNTSINKLLACRPRHPFYKALLDKIKYFFGFVDDSDSIGSRFITLVYEQYRDEKQLKSDHEDGVLFAPYQYFFYTLDKSQQPRITALCRDQYTSLKGLQKRACNTLKKTGFQRKPLHCTFTVFHWMKLNNRHTGEKEVFSFIPQAKQYTAAKNTTSGKYDFNKKSDSTTRQDSLPFGYDFKAEIFPNEGETRIPRIIHQKWKGTKVPGQFVPIMKTWMRNHPAWKYMYWTDESARAIVEDRHPYLLPYYDGYMRPIRRADLMRLVAIYEFGGIYADLDLESVKPIDPIVRKYACIIPREIPEHVVFGENDGNTSINTLLACRPKHPFYKMLLHNIQYFYGFISDLDTGPRYVTAIYQQYRDETNLEPDHEDGVYFAPYQYFINTLDSGWRGRYTYLCKYRFTSLTNLQRRACSSLKVYGFDRKLLPCTFTVHYWSHTNVRISILKEGDIFSFIPNAIIYGNQSST